MLKIMIFSQRRHLEANTSDLVALEDEPAVPQHTVAQQRWSPIEKDEIQVLRWEYASGRAEDFSLRVKRIDSIVDQNRYVQVAVSACGSTNPRAECVHQPHEVKIAQRPTQALLYLTIVAHHDNYFPARRFSPSP